jgi:hypothetical protein
LCDTRSDCRQDHAPHGRLRPEQIRPSAQAMLGSGRPAGADLSGLDVRAGMTPAFCRARPPGIRSRTKARSPSPSEPPVCCLTCKASTRSAISLAICGHSVRTGTCSMRCGAASATRHCWSVPTSARASGRCAAARGQCSVRFAKMTPHAAKVPGHAHRGPRNSPSGAADRRAQPETLQGVRELPERSRRRRVQSARLPAQRPGNRRSSMR